MGGEAPGPACGRRHQGSTAKRKVRDSVRRRRQGYEKHDSDIEIVFEGSIPLCLHSFREGNQPVQCLSDAPALFCDSTQSTNLASDVVHAASGPLRSAIATRRVALSKRSRAVIRLRDHVSCLVSSAHLQGHSLQSLTYCKEPFELN